jgi:hypothetical protein
MTWVQLKRSRQNYGADYRLDFIEREMNNFDIYIRITYYTLEGWRILASEPQAGE